MAQSYNWPVIPITGTITATNPSVGVNGAPIPPDSTLVGGVGLDGNLHPLSTDNSGVLNVNTTPTVGSVQHVIVDSSALPTGASTSANQVLEIADLDALAARTAGSLVPKAYDEIDLTYVPSGNGVGQVATAVYKLAAATVATLTMTYDSSNRLTSTVKT